MSTINKRSTRKRPSVVVLCTDSESDIEPTPAKKQKKKMGICGSNCKTTKKSDDCGKLFNNDSTDNTSASQNKSVSASKVDGLAASKPTTNNNKNVLRTSTGCLIGRTPWTEEQLLAELRHIDYKTSSNIVKLFDDGNTIPFICRYRRELIGNLDADQLRDIKTTYNHVQNIRLRAQSYIKDLAKKEALTEEIQQEILCAKSLDALDHLYAPFKTASKSTLFERARALGLQEVADQLLFEPNKPVQFAHYVNKSVEGLGDVERVKDGIKNIITHIFSKDVDVLDEIQNLLERKNNGIKIQTTVSSKISKPKSGKDDGKDASNKLGGADDPQKFQIYFDFQINMSNIQSHQVLAINRGENLKFLTVKIVVPDRMQNELYKIIRAKYFMNGVPTKERDKLLSAALNEAYSKKLKPLITRQIRSLLTKNAEKESVEVFAKNLKQLLLLRPVKGKKILGIDPGFRNGCKMALISERNDVLETDVIYPHTKKGYLQVYEHRLVNLLKEHRCELIAIGNGTACRETEAWIASLIQRDVFHTKSIRYCIVSENGASIYSCSEIAKQEFANLDVNLISAVSIARRLSDPLAELVKLDPKNLGIGMYQHDVNEKLLMESLNEVVMECVSFVGVDINTASVTLLRHIAGLNSNRAESIIKYRMEKGAFKSREELKKVKSIGEKTFVQCAGFIRIDPLTANANGKYNILDSTWVHPESYNVAHKIIKKLHLLPSDIGSSSFIAKIKQFSCDNENSMKPLGKEFGVPEERIKSILDGLSRELMKDYRDDSDIKPLFKQGVLKMSDLKEGTIVTGAIANITTFGCFVDIGVEHDGLIHVSQLGGMSPNIGDRVTAYVMSVDEARKRIQLRLESII